MPKIKKERLITMNGIMINIGGQERLLKFTHAAISKLEAILPDKDVYVMALRGSVPFSVESYAVAFALEGGGMKKPDVEVVKKWVQAYKEEHSHIELHTKLLQALSLSGLFGKKTMFQELEEDEEPAETETKNE